MNLSVTERDTDRGQPNRKRCRGFKDEDLIEHTRKSPRTRKNPKKRKRNAEDISQHQPLRKSPRLQKIRSLNKQRVKQAGNWTRSSLRTTRKPFCIGRRPSSDKRKSIKAPKKSHKKPAPTSGAVVDGSSVPTRKRHRDREDIVETQVKRPKSSENQAQPSRAVDTNASTLTLKNLERLDRQVYSQHLSFTEKTTLRDWEFANMPRSRRTETQSRRTEGTEDTSSSTKTISTSDSRFQEIAVKNGVLIPMQSNEPDNFSEIYDYFNRLRESVSPDVADYKEYLYDAVTADNEDTVKQAVLAQVKKYKDEGYRSAYNQQFTEFPSKVGFNNGLSTSKPDLIQGISLQAFEPYPVKDQLDGSAVPTSSLFPITLAHMAGEFKRPGGDLIQAQGQAAYDGASLVYGRITARESMGRADPPGSAHVGSFISDGIHITTFVHYAAKNSLGKVVYHQWPVTDTNIQLSHQSFKTGRRQLRNLQDWARENSYLLKKSLLDHYKLSQAQINEQSISEENSSAGNSVVVDSEPYVLVENLTEPESLSILEAETFYVTPESSDPAHSQRHDRPAPHVDMAKKIPKQRNTRSSARLSERRRREDRN